MSLIVRTVPNIMAHYGCSSETAQRYIDLRSEGYPQHQALLMAGLSDPPHSDPKSEGQPPPQRINIERLKKEAKKRRKTTALHHCQALDQIAVERGFDNWNALLQAQRERM